MSVTASSHFAGKSFKLHTQTACLQWESHVRLAVCSLLLLNWRVGAQFAGEFLLYTHLVWEIRARQ